MQTLAPVVAPEMVVLTTQGDDRAGSIAIPDIEWRES